MTADSREPPSALVIPGGLREYGPFETETGIEKLHPPKSEADPESMVACLRGVKYKVNTSLMRRWIPGRKLPRPE